MVSVCQQICQKRRSSSRFQHCLLEQENSRLQSFYPRVKSQFSCSPEAHRWSRRVRIMCCCFFFFLNTGSQAVTGGPCRKRLEPCLSVLHPFTGWDACARCSAADSLTCLVGLVSCASLGRATCCSPFRCSILGSRKNPSDIPETIGSSRPVASTSLEQLVAIVQLKQVNSPRRLVWHQLERKPARRDFRSVVCRLQWALCQLHSSAFLMDADSETTQHNISRSTKLLWATDWTVQEQVYLCIDAGQAV